MSKKANGEIYCDDCGGWDIEWMRRCHKHKADYCRGCECPICAEDEYYECNEPEYHEVDSHESGYD